MNTTGRPPPRFVPTLTEVVHDSPLPPARPPLVTTAQVATAKPAPVEGVAASRTLPPEFEEYVVHRVMQRVDLALEQRLREAIAQVMVEQTRSLIPRLREEVESVVRQSVYEAVAQELAAEREIP